jgi:hypothetical protein
MNAELTYYAQQGSMSDPDAYAPLYQNLPASIPELVKLVQNLTVHVFWAERYGLRLPPERMDELQLRSMKRRLMCTLELDPRALTEPRPLEKKLLGNCRDFSLLLTSFLRYQAIPARARCGFGAYFMPDHFEDHWVAEYWDQSLSRWVLVDAQLDAVQCGVLEIGFDTLDVPRDQFIVGGKAWQMCRSGEQDPEKIGIFDMHGLGFVRGNLVRDVAALNKMELLPWDCWGAILDDHDDLQALDEIAGLTANDVLDFEAVRNRYQRDARLRMDGSLLSYVNGRLIQVSVD